jgi:FixJ family two-component response regulator
VTGCDTGIEYFIADAQRFGEFRIQNTPALDGVHANTEAFTKLSLRYAATTFTSAEHFLKSAVVAQTTCLITDLHLPGQSGLELQEALRSQGYQMPVILVTAYPNDKHRTRAFKNGAVGFLSKPFDDRSLMECLTAAIKLHHKATT